MGDFRYIDHTADLGVRVTARDLDDLFATAALALYRAIGEPAVPDAPGENMSFSLESTDLEEALHDALSELLFLFEAHGLVMGGISVREEPGGGVRMDGVARKIDPEATVFDREVKAVTYHEISVTQTGSGFTAFFILDI